MCSSWLDMMQRLMVRLPTKTRSATDDFDTKIDEIVIGIVAQQDLRLRRRKRGVARVGGSGSRSRRAVSGLKVLVRCDSRVAT